ncbi:toxin-antitoxin system HicB family antitoxin [Amycolatopsis regifaucium]|uniref:HicB family protein n=1 Tax=Amycolatopsis regifaucium TaxID=546365 RepID=A0A154MK36_9PSEU|nr:toxin-antitoxin system HicB family antitoxin [Amycolatopsis regifaucium]KZB84666.1 HicB family protein [Amycolatopsis regifaucium]OKA11130.1 HicB family protein [Amycolatopsis regifaucium]SFI29547.1 HicB family protein [Amycolatopsis regifaucium]
MDLTPYITSLREDLANTASAGDEQTRRAAALLSSALEPAARLTLMNALADLAAEVTSALPGHVVDVRLDGRDVRVVVTGAGESTEQAPPRQEAPRETPRAPKVDTGDITRITLRLFEQVKGQAEAAAASQGVSLNTFVSQAVQGALGKGGGEHWHHKQKPGGGAGSHLHGWVQG